MPAIIEAHGVSKSFGTTAALDGLDLVVPGGEIHGFLGPNGAGKSTAIRVLLGLLRADSGSVRVLGRDPWGDNVEVHRRLAYVPGDVSLWPNLTGGEVIDLLGRLHTGHDRVRRQSLIERFDLDPRKKCRAYSKGNRQKVALVAALATDAELFIFDEPTSGLDPLLERVFRDILGELKAAGRTVLLSSHILSEVESSSDRISIIKSGRIVEEGSLGELRHLRRTTVSATLVRPINPAELTRLTGVHDVVVSDAGLHARLAVDPEALTGVLAQFAGHGVLALESAPPTLEELFLEKYARDDVPVPLPKAARRVGARR